MCIRDSATSAHYVVNAASSSLDFAGEIDSVMAKIEADGYDVTGFIAANTARTKLRNLRDSNGNFLFQPAMSIGMPATLHGQPLIFDAVGGMDATKALIIAGDWRNVIVGIRSDVEVKIYDQAVLANAAGAVTQSTVQEDKVFIRVAMRYGFQWGAPVTTSNATASRFPFAILKPSA